MKEQFNDNENNLSMDNAIAQLHHLTELQVELSAKKDMNKRGEDGGKAPAPSGSELQTPKNELLQRMITERQSKKGLVTVAEKKAMSAYIDTKIGALGSNATISNLTPAEKDQMVNYVKDVDEDMLYKKEGQARVDVGPVQKGVQNIPFLTTPRYELDVNKPYEKKYEKPIMPVNPTPHYKATDKNKPTPPEKPSTWYMGKESTQKAMEKYEQEQKKYEADLKKWEASKKYQAEKAEYDKKKKLWDDRTKNMDAECKDIEKALALGVLKTDYDPESKKPYKVAILTDKGEWMQKEFETPEEAQMELIKMTPTYNDFDGSSLAACMGINLSDDMLAAISTGDMKVEPVGKGDAIKATPVVNSDGEPESGTPTIIPTTDTQAVDKFEHSMDGYQKATGINYNEIDGRAYDNYEEKEKLSQGTTGEDGVKRCSVCGRKWDNSGEGGNGTSTTSTVPGVSDLVPNVPGVSDVVSNVQNAATDAATNAVTNVANNAVSSLTGGGLGFGAIAPRGIAKTAQKIRYRAGYIAWEKVDAATRLTKTSLAMAGFKKLTQGQTTGLMKHINMLLGNDKDLVEKFVMSLAESCSSSSSINQENVSDIVHGFSHQYSLNDLHSFIRGTACPLCGRDIPTEKLNAIQEISKARLTFKGKKITDNDAKKAFHGKKYVPFRGLAELLRDGTQQAFNPFIDKDATWTKFSFRPTDTHEGYPVINIIPASFRGMTNINVILNTTPYVVVSEYFMRNNVSSAVNLLQAVMEDGEAQDAKQASEPQDVKDKTMKLTEAIKNSFKDLEDPSKQVLDMPFVLYHRLKAKLYGNRYVFPYVPRENALSMSSNAEEWGGEGLLATLTNALHNAVNGITGMAGIGVSKPFPAPTWKLPDKGTMWEFTFDLNLMNDEYIRTRNNYMCANTIINNNRWIQKTILGFPGALYEVLVPTGVRELMCTGSFTLKALGVNRHVPYGFFKKPFDIGSKVFKSAAGKADIHSDAYEVIPDAYSLNCKFQSCIPENLNNSIFAYYLNITDFAPGTSTTSAFESADAAAPWESMVEPIEKIDDPVAIQKWVASVRHTLWPEEEEKAKKELAEKAKAAATAVATTQPPSATGAPATPTPAVPSIKSAKRDPLRWDEMSAFYSTQYNNLRNKLSMVREDISNKEKTLHELLKKSETLPLTSIRKTYAKRIAKVKDDIHALMKQEKKVEDSLIGVEIALLVRAKDKVEERTTSETLVVPRGYFDPYEVDEVTALKIKLMTRDELDKYISEREETLCSLDEWGIHNCRDFWIRAGVIHFIADAMNELEDLLRDTYETDKEQYDKYRYRYEMLQKDFEEAINPQKPFILNRTNLIYIDPATLPQGLLTQESEEEDDSTTASSSETNSTGGELTETNSSNENNVPAVIETDDGSLVVDRDELIAQHRAEVIKQEFGNEEKLAEAAFKMAVENEENPAARYDKEALILLKNTPELDEQTNLILWFREQEGEMYQNVGRRMISDDPSIAIFPSKVDRTKVTRKQVIFYLTQDLYRYVSSARMVLLGNAMDRVNTKATAVLNRVTNQFQRLEN